MMITKNKENLSRVKSSLVDDGYTGDPFAEAVKELLGATVVQQNLVSHPNIFSSLLPKPLAEQFVNLSQTTRKSRNWISPFSLRQIVEDYFRFYRQFSLRVEIPA